MKALLHSIFLFFIICSSCKTDVNYHINGTVKDNSLDGQFIYLQAIEGNRLITLDSTKVKNTRFNFKGIQDRPVIRELNFNIKQDDKRLSPLVFVLQSGKFEAVIDTISYISGTEQNDRLQEYFKKYHYYQLRMDDLISQYNIVSSSARFNDSLQIAFQEWYDSLYEEINTLSYDFIMINNNSVAGGLVFLQAYPNLTANQVETILYSAGSDFRSIHGVEIVEDHVRRDKQISAGNPYIDFSMTNIDGEQEVLSSFMQPGKWLLLDFWASWCLPCQEQIPFLKSLYRQYSREKLEIIGISLDYDRQEWLSAINRNELPWPQLSDLQGWDCEAALIYGIQTLPYTILINPKGEIVAKGIRPDMLEKKIIQLLGNTATASSPENE